MHAIAYERRRLTSVRSTWLVLVGLLLADAAVAALTARQPALAEPVRVLTAGVPLLPLPLAAIAAGAVGALSYGHEIRYPVLRAHLRPAVRRFQLLAAKLTVVGVFSAAAAALTLAVDGLALHFLAPHTSVRQFEHALVSGQVPAALLGYLAAAVAGGWTGLLGAALLRSAAAGLLLVVSLPVLAEPVVRALLDHRQLAADGLGALRWSRLFPVDMQHAWLYGPLSGLPGAAGLSRLELGALVGGPVLALFLVYALLLPRRSTV
ncbi:hypothetical protein [Streptacidiphilus monticola]|uniref:ABC transporter permease n=1 Tax=Streptacidiphilus monticola TaxID=2161674 RepID=A0ABW1G2V1_9ACTN